MPFTPEEKAFLDAEEKELQSLKSDKNYMQTQMQQQAIAIQQEERSITKEQLDLSQEYKDLQNLLKGNVLKIDEMGNQNWVKSDDPGLEILTEYGVNLIINFIVWYVNKNLLLSNYSEETINQKMEDLSNTLNDRIFMNYTKVFRYPTLDECKEVFLERIERKTELREFSLGLAGIEKESDEIKLEFIKEIEPVIEKEMGKIREQLMKERLTAFETLIRVIQDFIHHSYNRAYQGQERRSLRAHLHISENVGQSAVQNKPGKLNPLNWRG